ncbi:MAG: hypothetical protein BGO96_09055 [Micrococcales bacterium 73-15]|nr:MAG: hypothetical protein BGO96_09055 [Micrococcales bacterium 73-15]
MKVMSENRPTVETIEELHAQLRPVMRAVAAAVGPTCEVVLHDLTHRAMERTIVDIVNGHVSGRRVGGPSTNLGLIALADEGRDHDAYGYPGRTADGRDLSCSTVYYRNARGSIIGALCLNVDLTQLQAAQASIAALLPTRPAPEGGQPGRPGEVEVVGSGIEQVLEAMISEAIDAVGQPVAVMRKPARLEVVRLLETRGAFHVRQAVERVAERLGVSRVTAYGYLDTVRQSSASAGPEPTPSPSPSPVPSSQKEES